MIDLILYILALMCFIAATFGVSARVNLIALGLTFWVLTLVISGFTIGVK
jgi:hypothetical protein